MQVNILQVNLNLKTCSSGLDVPLQHYYEDKDAHEQDEPGENDEEEEVSSPEDKQVL